MRRVYLDHNATMPLRVEARQAMIAAMDSVGNPSSVHREGRAAKSMLEKARGDLAEAFGAEDAEVIFTSGATEAAALALRGRGLQGAEIEHDAVRAWMRPGLAVDGQGRAIVPHPAQSTLQAANPETGILQALPAGLAVCDMTQAFGKIPVSFARCGADMALISAHKLGGPKGVGALVMRRGCEVVAQLRGGGQEMGHRAGTENIIGAVGFAAVARAAVRDLANGLWEQVKTHRDFLEACLAAESPNSVILGRGGRRLPNTTCLATRGWRGETQVIQMDLAGFAISAGAACSSGKVRAASPTLQAMGHDSLTAASAIRVSLGPTTSRQDVIDFAAAWLQHRHRQPRGTVEPFKGQRAAYSVNAVA